MAQQKGRNVRVRLAPDLEMALRQYCEYSGIPQQATMAFAVSDYLFERRSEIPVEHWPEAWHHVHNY